MLAPSVPPRLRAGDHPPCSARWTGTFEPRPAKPLPPLPRMQTLGHTLGDLLAR